MDCLAKKIIHENISNDIYICQNFIFYPYLKSRKIYKPVKKYLFIAINFYFFHLTHAQHWTNLKLWSGYKKVTYHIYYICPEKKIYLIIYKMLFDWLKRKLKCRVIFCSGSKRYYWEYSNEYVYVIKNEIVINCLNAFANIAIKLYQLKYIIF